MPGTAPDPSRHPAPATCTPTSCPHPSDLLPEPQPCLFCLISLPPTQPPPSLLAQLQVHLALPSQLSASSPTAHATVPSAGWRLDALYPAPPAHTPPPPPRGPDRSQEGGGVPCQQKPPTGHLQATERKPFLFSRTCSGPNDRGFKSSTFHGPLSPALSHQQGLGKRE